MQDCVLCIFSRPTSLKDSNFTRRKLQPDKPLALRYRKKDAVPSIFPNAPDHLSKSRKSPRKTKLTTASSRREEAVRNIELLSESFRVFDDITGLPLDDIETRLINETTRPSGFKTTVTDQGLLMYIITTNDTVPTIYASVTVSSELSLTVCCNGSAIPESLYSDIVNGSLQTMSQLHGQPHGQSQGLCRRFGTDVTRILASVLVKSWASLHYKTYIH
jgi:hypothetical protein